MLKRKTRLYNLTDITILYLFPILFIILINSPAVYGSTLQKHTAEAYTKYTASVEKELETRAEKKLPFLRTGSSPNNQSRLVRGHTIIENLNKKDKTPDGIIHDWIGSIFIPGANRETVLEILTDYDSHKTVFDEVIDSKLLDKSGNHIKSYLRYKKKEILTIVTDTWYEAVYKYYPGRRAQLISRSTRINEVENFDQKDERLKPEGEDNGFLWRMNTYWSLLDTEDGVIVECRSVSLSRAIPPGLGLIIKPINNRMPRNSLSKTLNTLKILAADQEK